MSTRSSIAVVKSDGTVEAVYCHFDGDLKGVGAALLASFDSQERAEGLVALGDLSSVAGGVVAYHRDRKEPFADVAPKHYRTFEEYRLKVPNDIADNGFRYFFQDGCWHVWGKTGHVYLHQCLARLR